MRPEKSSLMAGRLVVKGAGANSRELVSGASEKVAGLTLGKRNYHLVEHTASKCEKELKKVPGRKSECSWGWRHDGELTRLQAEEKLTRELRVKRYRLKKHCLKVKEEGKNQEIEKRRHVPSTNNVSLLKNSNSKGERKRGKRVRKKRRSCV